MKTMELSVLAAGGIGAVFWLFLMIAPGAEGMVREMFAAKGCAGAHALCPAQP